MSEIVFNGSVQDVVQRTGSPVTGTWLENDQAWAIIGTSMVKIKLGATVTTQQVASALTIAINASDTTTGLVDETRNIGGQTRGEFKDVIAATSGSTVYLTSRTAGVDFTVEFGTDSVSGVIGALFSTSTATGKNWFNNADNWEGGVIPGDGDIAVFRDSAIHCTRGLNTIANFDGVKREGTYTANIGLPKINNTHSGYPYPEYRNRFLKVDTLNEPAMVRIGDGTGTSNGITKINNYRHDCRYYINDTAVADTVGYNPIEIISDDGDTGGGVEATVILGDVDIGTRGGDYTNGFGCEIEHIRVWGGNVRVEGQVEPSSELAIYGGIVETFMALTNFTTFVLEGGKLIHHEGACSAFVVNSGATVDYRSGTAASGDLEVMSGGILTFDNDQRSKQIVNFDILLHEGAAFYDTYGVAAVTGTGQYHFINCNTSATTILPKNYKYTPIAL